MIHHVCDRAGFLASLDKGDPERRIAEEHAQACGVCREALDEGRRLMARVAEALEYPPPSPDVLARTAAAIEREASDDQDTQRRLEWASASGVVVAWAFQLMVGSGWAIDVGRAAVSLGVLALAVACATLLRSRGRLAIGLVIATSAILAYAAGHPAALDAHIGIRCTFRELWAAAITWTIVTVVARRLEIKLGRWNMMAVAGGGALAAHAGQHLACEVPHADGHLLLFHFGGVLLAVLLAAAGTRATSTVSAES
jgi:hypothetical protein